MYESSRTGTYVEAGLDIDKDISSRTLQILSAVSRSQFHLRFCCTGTADVPWSLGDMMASSPITQGGGYLLMVAVDG